MSKLAVWNPWKLMPRDFFDVDDDWSGPIGDNQLDMYENDNSIVVEVKAPGFSKDDVEISIENGRLKVQGSVKTKTEEGDKKKKNRKYYRKEIKTMSFTRVVDLPVSVVSSKAKASFKNGVLRVDLPKSEEAKPKKIEVEVE